MTKSGKFIKSISGHEFMLTLDNEGVEELEADEYVVMIDPVWETTSDKKYMDVLVDVYSPFDLKLQIVNE